MTVPWRWLGAGVVLGAAAVGAWWAVERAAWVAGSQAALDRAVVAEQISHDLRVELITGQVWADSVRRAGEAEADRARAAERRADRVSATADRVTAELAAATTAADSIPLLLARDSARVEEIAQVRHEAASWRSAFESQRARGDSLAVLVAAAQEDADRLRDVNRDLQQRVLTGVPKPKRILGLPLPKCGPGVVVGLDLKPEPGVGCVITL